MDPNDAPALLQHHRSLIARLSRRLGRSNAEDLASEALVRSLRRPAPDGRQAPWLERICRNLRVDDARGQARAIASLSRAPDPSPVATPEDEALGRERRDAILAEIPSMPVELREALIARFVDDRGYADLAAAEGISPAAARTRVFRALERLRISLARLRSFICTPGGFSVKGLSTALLAPCLTVAVALPAVTPAPVTDATAIPALLAHATTLAPRHRRSLPPVERSSIVVPVAAAASGSVPTDSARTAAKIVSPQANTRHATPQAEPTADTAAVQRFKFDDDTIDGESDSPDFDWVVGDPPPGPRPSLIEIPRSFASELLKTLEDL
jgi:RNA polymerase sigma factor (sigma-70 family)